MRSPTFAFWLKVGYQANTRICNHMISSVGNYHIYGPLITYSPQHYQMVTNAVIGLIPATFRQNGSGYAQLHPVQNKPDREVDRFRYSFSAISVHTHNYTRLLVSQFCMLSVIPPLWYLSAATSVLLFSRARDAWTSMHVGVETVDLIHGYYVRIVEIGRQLD